MPSPLRSVLTVELLAGGGEGDFFEVRAMRVYSETHGDRSVDMRVEIPESRGGLMPLGGAKETELRNMLTGAIAKGQPDVIRLKMGISFAVRPWGQTYGLWSIVAGVWKGSMELEE